MISIFKRYSKLNCIVIFCVLPIIILSCISFKKDSWEEHSDKTIPLLQSLDSNRAKLILYHYNDVIIKTDLKHFIARIRTRVLDTAFMSNEYMTKRDIDYSTLLDSVIFQASRMKVVNVEELSKTMKSVRSYSNLYEACVYYEITSMLRNGECMVIHNSKIAKEVRIIYHSTLYSTDLNIMVNGITIWGYSMDV